MLNINRRERYSKIKGENKNIIKGDVPKIHLPFDLHALQLMSCYVLSTNKNIRRSHLINLRNLMEIMDEEPFKNDPEKLKRITFIKRSLEGRISEGLKDPVILIKYVYGGLIDDIPINSNELLNNNLSSEELEWINNTVASSIKYAFLHNHIDEILRLGAQFKSADYSSIDSIVKQIEEWVDQTKSRFRRTKVDKLNSSMFSLTNGFEDNMKDIHEKLASMSSGLQCGTQGMNELIGGKFQNGRCYLYLAAAGMGKSTLLLNMAYQIKKYNKNYQTKDPTKIPCIVLLTMENTVPESVERLFNISSIGDDIRNFSADEVIQILQNEGELYINDESPVDIIIKYVPNGSVDTGYLYTLVEELEDDGYECICMVQDYVRRIRSAYKTPDLRIEMGEIINEFKTFAIIKDIPVITAAQLNRDGSKTLEEGKMNNKSDLIRFLGRAQVGESMLMIDNTDVCFVIDMEYDTKGSKYLGIKRIKERYRILSDRNTLYLPFDDNNGIKLLEDVYLPIPTCKDTLKENVIDVSNFNNGSNYVVASAYHQERKDIDEIIAERRQALTEGNIFPISKYRQNQSNPVVNTTMETTLINPMRMAI